MLYDYRWAIEKTCYEIKTCYEMKTFWHLTDYRVRSAGYRDSGQSDQFGICLFDHAAL